MDFNEVHVLQGQSLAGQQTRHRVRRGHEQAFVTADEVHRGGLGIDDLGQRCQMVLGGPVLAGEQHRGGTVRERSGVSGGHRGLAGELLTEHGAQGGQLLHGGIRTHVVVPGHTLERGDQVVEEPAIVGGGQVPMRGRGNVILILAAHLPLLGGQRLVLPHAQSGPGFPRGGGRGDQVVGAQVLERLELLSGGLGALQLQQRAAQTLTHGNGCVRGGVHTARNSRFDLAQFDLVRQSHDRFQPSGAGLLQVVNGRLR